MLATEFPQVRVLANARNAGFTRANNQALAVARARYFFLLNPDTELRPGATRALVEFMDRGENSRVGIVGPQLVYPDGSIQPSRRRFPAFSTALLESTKLQQWFPHTRALKSYYVLDRPEDETGDVDWVVGAGLFARRALYLEIGGMDERFFMYSEELDWCKRAKTAGWRVVFLPGAQVVHYEGKSSEQNPAQRDIHFHTSKVRYFKKHEGALRGELLRLFLLANFVYLMGEEGVKYLLGHKRALRAARIQAYRQVLASGLN
jgi:GT2 family glycosyltransferase